MLVTLPAILTDVPTAVRTLVPRARVAVVRATGSHLSPSRDDGCAGQHGRPRQ